MNIQVGSSGPAKSKINKKKASIRKKLTSVNLEVDSTYSFYSIDI